jgi:hypothetical protein
MRPIVLFMALVGFYVVNAQSDPIPWDPNRPLTWEDFRGNPDDDQLEAMTNSEIDASGMMKEGLPYFKLTAVFIPSGSWTRGSGNEELLRHEQLHFNITELFVRKIRKEMDALRKRGEKDPAVYTQTIMDWSVKWKEKQAKYDEETDHGKNTNEQKAWGDLVNKELLALNAYTK